MSPTENRQIADIKEIVEDQGEQIKQLLASVTHIKEGNDRIEVLLIGDKFTKNKGLIDKVEDIADRLSAVEKLQSMFKWKYAGAVMLLGGISFLAGVVYYIVSTIHNLSK